VFLLVLCAQTFAQLPTPSFYHLKRDFELFGAHDKPPFEDPYGFMWFGSGTGGGLYRYDGYDLICFHADPNHKAETIATDLINFKFLKKYIRDDGGYVVMSDGKTIPIAKRRKEEFLSRMKMN